MSKMDYGEIKSNHLVETRIGDYGYDKDGNMFYFSSYGWKPLNQYKYEAYYWKKKYLELETIYQNKLKELSI